MGSSRPTDLPRGGRTQIEDIENLPSYLSGGREIAMMEIQREEARVRFLCKVSSILKFLTFPETTALQRKLSLSLRAGCGHAGRVTLPLHATAAGRCLPIFILRSLGEGG